MAALRVALKVHVDKFLELGGVVRKIPVGVTREPLAPGLRGVMAEGFLVNERRRRFATFAATHEEYTDDHVPSTGAESWELVGARTNRLRTVIDSDHDDYGAESFA